MNAARGNNSAFVLAVSANVAGTAVVFLSAPLRLMAFSFMVRGEGRRRRCEEQHSNQHQPEKLFHITLV